MRSRLIATRTRIPSTLATSNPVYEGLSERDTLGDENSVINAEQERGDEPDCGAQECDQGTGDEALDETAVSFVRQQPYVVSPLVSLHRCGDPVEPPWKSLQQRRELEEVLACCPASGSQIRVESDRQLVRGEDGAIMHPDPVAHLISMHSAIQQPAVPIDQETMPACPMQR
jgi:hypothetical protein